MNLKIDARLSLGYFIPSDVEPLSEYLNDKAIYHNTLRIPHPYTYKDSEDWVAANMEKQQSDAVIENYTIRYDDQLIGGIGFMPGSGPRAHSAEIGYWLAAPYRNKGIMTKVVGFFSDLLFENYRYQKLFAYAYADNIASQKVLENNGFAQEGFLRKHYSKDGQYIDCKLYGRLKDSETNFKNWL
jgi:[ribosomal protein S5]-alanine N-acetyltransferase